MSEEPSGDAEIRRSPPSEAFAALSSPLRVDILRELSAQQRQLGGDSLGFADLRRRVDVEDSGRFRYHLKQLQDTFVQKTDAGYRLTHAGHRVIAAILAGTFTGDQSLGPVELDSECPECHRPAVATYEDGRCLVSCANDHTLFTWSVPPNATASLNLPGLIDLAELLALQAVEQALAGVCPECFDPISSQIRTAEAARPAFQGDCESCGAQIAGPVDLCLLVDPEVAAFCHRHGHSPQDDHVWESPFVRDDAELVVVDDDPVQIEYTLTLNGESLSGEISENGHITVHRTGSTEGQSDAP